MLVQKEEFRVGHRGHHEGQGLTLAARKQADRLLHTVLEAHVQESEAVTEGVLLGAGDMTEPAAGAGGEGEVLLNRHAGGAAEHGVLKQAADDLGSAVLREEGDIASVEEDTSGIGIEASSDGIK